MRGGVQYRPEYSPSCNKSTKKFFYAKEYLDKTALKAVVLYYRILNTNVSDINEPSAKQSAETAKKICKP